jgi:hypothetical protein
MQPFAKSIAKSAPSWSVGRLCAVLLAWVACIPYAHAGATLLLEEPYSYDGTFAGTGHVAVYLNNVCSASPVVLRRCTAGETGVVLSRYDGIAGRDWVAIPIISYLYAVERPDAVPLFADAKLVAFLRDQYRRHHLQVLAPDRPDGGTPEGNWYELIGSSYDRTIYGFEIETDPKQDALLIDKFNNQPNLERYNFAKRNCADFVREVINFYYPRALHRSVVGDLGVTTPKQIAKVLVNYSRHHPELESLNFMVPQVPGTIGRSKPIHGVLESVMAAKKYMLPLVVLHPYIGGGLLIEYFGHRHFDPSRNALVLDSQHDMDAPMTRDERTAYLSRMNELIESSMAAEAINDVEMNEGKPKELKAWERLQAGATPAFDTAGHPVLQMGEADDSTQVGITRSNILGGSDSPGLAARMVEARLRQELRSSNSRKTSHSDVERDLKLFQQLLALQPKEAAVTPHAIGATRTRAVADSQ